MYQVTLVELKGNKRIEVGRLPYEDAVELKKSLEEKIEYSGVEWKVEFTNLVDSLMETIIRYENQNSDKKKTEKVTNIVKSKIAWEKFNKAINKLLKETDFTQLADAPLSSDEKKHYRGYRKYLRDLASKHTDGSVWTAEIMEFDKWKSQ